MIIIRAWTILLVLLVCWAAAAQGQSTQIDEPWLWSPELLTADLDAAEASEGDPLGLDEKIQQASCCEPLPGCVPQAEATYPKIRFTGFFQADVGWINQDAANVIAVDNIQDGADFRRARLASVGEVAENVGYSIEFDFGLPGRPNFMDVWLELRDLHLLQNLRIGQFRMPFGLGGMTSVKELTFLERGLPFAFLPFRQIGAMAFGANDAEDVTVAVSLFRFPTDFFGGQIGDSGGYGTAMRVTTLLMEDDEFALHVGGAYSLIDPANNAIRYLSQPEFFIAETGGAAFVPGGVPTFLPPFVDTKAIPTEMVNLFAGELAVTNGSFHAQSEAIYSSVNRLSGSNVNFSGVSAQLAYILTGEHRAYNRKAGALGAVVPRRPFGRCGCGAWEVAGRWSYLDLDDADVRGGKLNDVTLGLNWYLNVYTKFQFNYIRAMLDSPINGDSNADIVAARAQLVF